MIRPTLDRCALVLTLGVFSLAGGACGQPGPTAPRCMAAVQLLSPDETSPLGLSGRQLLELAVKSSVVPFELEGTPGKLTNTIADVGAPARFIPMGVAAGNFYDEAISCPATLLLTVKFKMASEDGRIAVDQPALLRTEDGKNISLSQGLVLKGEVHVVGMDVQPLEGKFELAPGRLGAAGSALLTTEVDIDKGSGKFTLTMFDSDAEKVVSTQAVVGMW
jgi:hypothetical protein